MVNWACSSLLCLTELNFSAGNNRRMISVSYHWGWQSVIHPNMFLSIPFYAGRWGELQNFGILIRNPICWCFVAICHLEHPQERIVNSIQNWFQYKEACWWCFSFPFILNFYEWARLLKISNLRDWFVSRYYIECRMAAFWILMGWKSTGLIPS